MSGTASIAAMSDRLLTAIFCFSSTLRRRRRLGDHLQGRAGFDTLLLSASIFLRSGLSVMAVFKTETILHKAVRDVGKEPDLSEKAQGLGVIGYGARQAEKAAIALEDGDPKAGQPKQVRCHQPDGAGPDDRDVVFSHRSGFCCGMFHRRFPFGKFMLHIYVISTK